MKLAFFSLPEREQRIYFQEAAARRNVAAIILEKDFWVCWLLAVLFGSRFRDSLVFKGGTSLSKVFQVIDRFSEDIDLSLSPTLLNLPAAAGSRNQADKWMAKAEAACATAVRTLIQPLLEAEANAALGSPDREAWFDFVIDSTSRSPTLLFHYPSHEPSGLAYLRRVVRLEFGSLTDQQPVGTHQVTPWIMDALPGAIPDWHCSVIALGLDRTFWEKATILHVEHHRPAEKSTPERFSRHYADVAALARHPTAQAVIEDRETCTRVAEWKSRFFGCTWASYESARPGSFRLVPVAARLPALRQDFRAMRDMYLGLAPSFDDVIADLTDLEQRINSTMIT